MSNDKVIAAAGIVAAVIMTGGPAAADGNAERGRKAFRNCAACHTVENGDHRTGPSLANIWGRKAGTIDGFRRYSKALKNSGVVWNEKTLDQWLSNPKALIPGNRMIFRGMKNGAERTNLIAFLKHISGEGAGTTSGMRGGMMGRMQSGMMGGMQGGMMGQRLPNLKELGPNNQVKSVTHCADTFEVTTRNEETHQFWELNLRLKIDSSENGPTKGMPALIPGGMRGDRANLVFSSSEEISVFIQQKC